MSHQDVTTMDMLLAAGLDIHQLGALGLAFEPRLLKLLLEAHSHVDATPILMMLHQGLTQNVQLLLAAGGRLPEWVGPDPLR